MTELRFLFPEPVDLPAVEPEQARFRLFDGIASFLTRVSARQPLLLVLDDLHWADASSLQFLQFLAQTIHDSPLLLLGTYRDVEIDRQHPLTATLAELVRQPHTRRVVLQELPMPDVARFIAAVAGQEPSAALVDAVYRRTEGNPFFVNEVVRLLAIEDRLEHEGGVPAGRLRVPESVREVVGRRLGQLAEDCQTALSAAAVLGREFELALLEQTGVLSSDQLLAALDEAERARQHRSGVAPRSQQPYAYPIDTRLD